MNCNVSIKLHNGGVDVEHNISVLSATGCFSSINCEFRIENKIMTSLVKRRKIECILIIQ
jgi:hypothetical protein